MKVNGSTPGGVDALHLISDAPARPVASASSASGGRPVVDLSTKTQALRAIDVTGPIEDEALIAEIRDRISSGRFAIDYARIADSMLAAGQVG
ncbi:MAG: flagellar biosynthesis anti-sigma factor FlgM [Betaproteobacteria bacterium]|jgi:flagellar biosynthesis anti-sigma factor FlgM|nr:flagellar biosynthesis anti-sigma factor FlgM [Betaproteobacteria bacterium]